jgi:hypothetical protein
MPAKVSEGTLVVRQWGRAGLTESPRTFHTLDELYAHCLKTDDPEVVDRIVIHGQDERGHPRTLTFVFQSMTVSPEA